jgi:hypothetical protein
MVVKARATSIAATLAGLLLGGQPVRADECDTILDNVDDAVQVASKILQLDMADIQATTPADNAKASASVKNTFCSASGEFLGVSRVFRVIASECLKGSKRRDTLASLDKSIGELRDSIRPACE